MPKLWLVGKVALEELSFLLNIFHNMMQVEKDMVHPKQFYHHETGKTLILNEITNIIIKNKLDAIQIFTLKEQLMKLNIDNHKKVKMVLVSATLPHEFLKRMEVHLQA